MKSSGEVSELLLDIHLVVAVAVAVVALVLLLRAVVVAAVGALVHECHVMYADGGRGNKVDAETEKSRERMIFGSKAIQRGMMI